MKKIFYTLPLFGLIFLLGCTAKQEANPITIQTMTGRKTFTATATGRNFSFQYPAEYTVETDKNIPTGTIWIKHADGEYRFDAGNCGWESQANKFPITINGKLFFRVDNDVIVGEKYFYYHNYPNLDSCIVFDAEASNDSWYIQTFETIMNSIVFN